MSETFEHADTPETHTETAPERPDWLPEKFKTPEDLTQSYKSLEQRLGSAPKEYDLSKGADWMTPEYEGFNDMLQLAREKSVPQDVMDAMLESTGRYINEFSENIDDEKAKLGDNADERIGVLNNWAKSNLSEDSYYALTDSLTTAGAVKALEELRSKALDNNTLVPNGNVSPESSAATLEDIQDEMSRNFEKYKTDKSYRNEILNKMNKLQVSGYVDKSSA